MANGVAISIASTATSAVPNSRPAAYGQKLA